MAAPRRPARSYGFFGKPGECLESQCLESQCLESQCLESQCLESQCLESQCLESYGINYVFHLGRAIVAPGNHPQGQQRVRIGNPGGVCCCRKIWRPQCKGCADRCDGAIAQLCEGSPCTPDAGEQRLH